LADRKPEPRAAYVQARAEVVPFGDWLFNTVCMTDALENVDDLTAVLDECALVLRPGGMLVFDTINRTWRSRVGIIRATQWLLRLAPPRTHSFERFIRPAELQAVEGREWRASGAGFGSESRAGGVVVRAERDA